MNTSKYTYSEADYEAVCAERNKLRSLVLRMREYLVDEQYITQRDDVLGAPVVWCRDCGCDPADGCAPDCVLTALLRDSEQYQ